MASESGSNSGHLSTGKKTVTREDRPPGPVTKHHLLALGNKNMSQPQGVAISKTTTICNGGRKGW